MLHFFWRRGSRATYAQKKKILELVENSVGYDGRNLNRLCTGNTRMNMKNGVSQKVLNAIIDVYVYTERD